MVRNALIVPRSHPALITLIRSDKLPMHAVRKVSGGAQVTRRRLRWLAVQSVVVTVLAVVVVLTLLKPESNRPLSGISGGDRDHADDRPRPRPAPGGGRQSGRPDGGRRARAQRYKATTRLRRGTGNGSASGPASGTPVPCHARRRQRLRSPRATTPRATHRPSISTPTRSVAWTPR